MEQLNRKQAVNNYRLRRKSPIHIVHSSYRLHTENIRMASSIASPSKPSNEKNDVKTNPHTPTPRSHRDSHTKFANRMSNASSNNNNYAAPNTPIASVKRPRRVSTEATARRSNKATTTPSLSSHNPQQQQQYNRKEMSPMHPPKAVPRGLHGNGDDENENDSYHEDRLPPSAIGVVSSSSSNSSPISSPSLATEEEGQNILDGTCEEGVTDATADAKASSNNGSWVGRKVDAIFSPVLNFLNGMPVDEDEVDVDEKNRQIKEQIQNQKMQDKYHHQQQRLKEDELWLQRRREEEAEEEQKKGGETVVDRDGDVTMGDVDASPVMVCLNESNDIVVRGKELEENNDDAATDDVNNGNNDHNEINNGDNDDDDEDDEGLEFNPYLFISSLPPYHSVAPHSRRRIHLPPRDPNDESRPISLILDLDETLVHCTVEPTPDADMIFPVVFHGTEYKVHVRTRPYLLEFLEAVHSKFEVIVFTASQQVYADELLNRIDPGEFSFVPFLSHM